MGLKLPSPSSFLSETSNVRCRQCDAVTWSPICTLCLKLVCNRQNKQAKCSPFRDAAKLFIKAFFFFFGSNSLLQLKHQNPKGESKQTAGLESKRKKELLFQAVGNASYELKEYFPWLLGNI